MAPTSAPNGVRTHDHRGTSKGKGHDQYTIVVFKKSEDQGRDFLHNILKKLYAIVPVLPLLPDVLLVLCCLMCCWSSAACQSSIDFCWSAGSLLPDVLFVHCCPV